MTERELRKTPVLLDDESFRKENEERKHVRAFIANTSMPKSIAEVYDEAVEDFDAEHNRFDIEVVLQFREEDAYVVWTAPKWAKPGDVVLFMLARTSDYAVKQLIKEYESKKGGYPAFKRYTIEPMLLKAQWLADNFAGKIVAVGRIASTPYREAPPMGSVHYKSPVYADVDNICLLENPVHLDEFKSFVYIGRGVTITPVLGRTFDRLKRIIGQSNELPDYARNAIALPELYAEIDETNWREIAAKSGYRFMLEGEFRSCFLDFLLAELSEENVFSEVRLSKESGFGIADNVIVIDGRYLPVEVKLNVAVEKDIEQQLKKYCHVSEIVFGDGRLEPGEKARSDFVLVFDTQDVYMYQDSKSELSKLCSLAEFSSLPVEEMKELILRALR